MTIEKMSSPAFTVLELTGEIDLHSSGSLRSALKVCSDAQTPVVLMDFKRVGYIDSSGLAILIEYLKEAAKFGGKFALFGLEKKVATLFELVRLDQLFVIAEDQEGALARLGVSR
jgi:anti-sigma B factor antagonist